MAPAGNERHNDSSNEPRKRKMNRRAGDGPAAGTGTGDGAEHCTRLPPAAAPGS
jgi:hypothetical protein